jgi:hypothetical protein
MILGRRKRWFSLIQKEKSALSARFAVSIQIESVRESRGSYNSVLEAFIVLRLSH